MHAPQVATVEQALDFLLANFPENNRRKNFDLVRFSTVHGAKGLESDRVFIVDPWRMPSTWAKSPAAKMQEQNLIYVARTRARFELIEIEVSPPRRAASEEADS